MTIDRSLFDSRLIRKVVAVLEQNPEPRLEKMSTEIGEAACNLLGASQTENEISPPESDLLESQALKNLSADELFNVRLQTHNALQRFVFLVFEYFIRLRAMRPLTPDEKNVGDAVMEVTNDLQALFRKCYSEGKKDK